MKVGILGGGQLARMLALAGYPLGLEFVCYDKDALCCAADLMPVVVGELQDHTKLQQFSKLVNLITYENENIPVATAQWLAAEKDFYPGTEILEKSQDRLLEKQLFQALDIATNQFFPVNHRDDLLLAGEKLGYPFLLKTRKEGYDGKGQLKVMTTSQAQEASLTSSHGYIAEEWIAFEKEVSVIACRSISGDVVFYDLCENQHRDGILHQTQNRVRDPLAVHAEAAVRRILERFAYVGVLTIEFFVKDGQLLANEIAPRVHNSGHWTIEGAVTSQFENHLRAIAGYPLGVTTSCGQAVMTNLLGHIPDKHPLLNTPGLHLHDYHKAPRPGRKVGHVTRINVK